MEKLPEYKYFLDEKKDKQSDKIFIRFAIVLFVIYAFIFGVASIYRSNFQYITINGASMQPTLNANPIYKDGKELQDGVYVKVTNNIDYGDIIVINKENEKDESIIKRALAFGGDYITIASVGEGGNRDYRFMRVKKGTNNVEILKEDYILSYDYWNITQSTVVDDVEYERGFYYNFKSLGYETAYFDIEIDGQDKSVVFFKVPKDDVFYMGDNRTGSYDARHTGTTNKKRVLGYVVKVVNDAFFKKQDSVSWFFQEIGDFFSIVWREIEIFFGSKR